MFFVDLEMIWNAFDDEKEESTIGSFLASQQKYLKLNTKSFSLLIPTFSSFSFFDPILGTFLRAVQFERK